MVKHSSPMFHPWCARGLPVVPVAFARGCPWLVRGLPVVCPWFAHGLPGAWCCSASDARVLGILCLGRGEVCSGPQATKIHQNSMTTVNHTHHARPLISQPRLSYQLHPVPACPRRGSPILAMSLCLTTSQRSTVPVRCLEKTGILLDCAHFCRHFFKVDF